ncbi:MAG: murein biosynthesis integral membrane protein MurJ [Desulfobacterales bacterium]|jgi:putative peptidoglycan lipid II flippase
MSQSVYKKVGIASIIMMASVLLSNLIGLIREMVIAYVRGAGQEVDAYQLSFLIPEILNHLLASGFLSITFIPIFSHYLARDQENEGWHVFSIIFTNLGIILICLICLAEGFTTDIISILAPGYDATALRVTLIRMTRIIIPAQFFFFASGLFMAVQFAKEKFSIPALAPIIYNVGIILGGILLGSRLGMVGFSWGVLAGAISNCIVQYMGARRLGMRLRICFELNHPDLRRYIVLTLPLMIGLTMTFSREFFFRIFGSYLPPGGISGINYGLKIMLIPVALFGQAIGTAAYPFMARLVVEEKMAEMNHLLNNTLRYLALVIPVCMLLMVLKNEVVLIIYQRGQFDAAATALTADILIYLLVGAFALAAYTIVPRAFYAMQNTVFPAIYGSIAVLLSIPFYYLGLRFFGAKGIALAISLSGILQVLFLYMLWNKRSDNQGSRQVYIFYAKMIFFSAFLFPLLSWFKTSVLIAVNPATFSGSILVILLTGATFILIMGIVTYRLNIKEVLDVAGKIVTYLKRLMPHQ